MKACNKCKVKKELKDFKNDSRNSDGVQGICKECNKNWQTERRKQRNLGVGLIKVESKTCTRCSEVKNINEFFRDAGFSDGHMSMCKPCKTNSAMKWREANREKYNENQRLQHKKNYQRNRLYRYEITPEQLQQMTLAQDNKCAICVLPDQKLVIDHCHDTDKVRGLLCYGCNRLMVLVDNPELLAKAIAYKNKA